MAAGPIPREEALKKGGADLRFTLSRNDVQDDLQAAFFTNGITTIQKFSSFFRSEDDLITVMRTPSTQMLLTDWNNVLSSLQSFVHGGRLRRNRNVKQKLKLKWTHVSGQSPFQLVTTSTSETHT